MSEETGTLSLSNQGRLERPITSSRLLDLLKELIGSSNASSVGKQLAVGVSTPKTASPLKEGTSPSRGSVGNRTSSKEP